MKNKGFTLIEVLLIVAIIGVLVSIAIPMSYEFRQKAFENTVEQDVRNAGSAAEGYYAETLAYPNFGPFTGRQGSSNYNIAPKYTIKLSQNVTLKGTVQADGSLIITATHPGATNPITYDTRIGAVK